MARTLSKEDALDIVVRDAAGRAGVDADDVRVESAEDAAFPNAALGAARDGEMSFDMVTNGWTIRVSADGQKFEYRASARQVRLAGGDGRNLVIFPA